MSPHEVRKRRRAATLAAVTVPPPLPPLAPVNRAPLAAATVRYAYEVHRADQHHGRIGRDCRTCTRYARGITDATAGTP